MISSLDVVLTSNNAIVNSNVYSHENDIKVMCQNLTCSVNYSCFLLKHGLFVAKKFKKVKKHKQNQQ